MLLKEGGQSLVCSSFLFPRGCPGVSRCPWEHPLVGSERRGMCPKPSSKYPEAETRARFPGSRLCVLPAKAIPPLPITPQVGYLENYETWTGYMGSNLTSSFPRCIILETFLNLSFFFCFPSFLCFFLLSNKCVHAPARCLVEFGLLDTTWTQCD